MQIKGSHIAEISATGDKVTIRDLELFVGFDPSIDDGADEGVKKYNKGRIDEVVARTAKFIDRGQRPKLVINHDREGENAPDEAVGDILNVYGHEINGAPGILGDVEMSIDDFNRLIKSNKYPRRSAEIWSDGFMSEVALLGRDTPRRPLPDTKFTRPKRDGHTREVFTRDLPVMSFAEPTGVMHGPGPNNVFIPSDEDTAMEEINKLKAELAAATAKLAKYEQDGESKSKELNTRIAAVESERDDFKRAAETQANETIALRNELRQEKFTRQLDQMQAEGYRIPDRAAVLERVTAASDPDKELDFLKGLMQRDPIGVRIDQSQFVQGSGGAKTATAEKEASRRATKRCTDEANPEAFSRYYAEELAKV